jgi:hypothetical protein
MGPQRFAELWRAPDSLPDAYRRLTGVPVDTLAYRVVTQARSAVRAGASVTPGEFLVVLMIAGLLAGLATLSHPRRRRP